MEADREYKDLVLQYASKLRNAFNDGEICDGGWNEALTALGLTPSVVAKFRDVPGGTLLRVKGWTYVAINFYGEWKVTGNTIHEEKYDSFEEVYKRFVELLPKTATNPDNWQQFQIFTDD